MQRTLWDRKSQIDYNMICSEHIAAASQQTTVYEQQHSSNLNEEDSSYITQILLSSALER